MPGKEAKDAGGYTEPTEAELADPIAQLSAEYIGLLRTAHSTYQPWEPTDNQRQEVEDAIVEIKAAVPEISDETLRKMIFDNPNDMKKGWALSAQTPSDITEFHRLAELWDNRDFSGNRQIAEDHYGVTQVEVDFLVKGARILPLDSPFIGPQTIMPNTRENEREIEHPDGGIPLIYDGSIDSLIYD